eukprot:5595213-Amphidinium_carterae.1
MHGHTGCSKSMRGCLQDPVSTSADCDKRLVELPACHSNTGLDTVARTSRARTLPVALRSFE